MSEVSGPGQEAGTVMHAGPTAAVEVGPGRGKGPAGIMSRRFDHENRAIFSGLPDIPGATGAGLGGTRRWACAPFVADLFDSAPPGTTRGVDAGAAPDGTAAGPIDGRPMSVLEAGAHGDETKAGLLSRGRGGRLDTIAPWLV